MASPLLSPPSLPTPKEQRKELPGLEWKSGQPHMEDNELYSQAAGEGWGCSSSPHPSSTPNSGCGWEEVGGPESSCLVVVPNLGQSSYQPFLITSCAAQGWGEPSQCRFTPDLPRPLCW